MSSSTSRTAPDGEAQRETRLCKIAARNGYLLGQSWRPGVDEKFYIMIDTTSFRIGDEEEAHVIGFDEATTLDEVEAWLAECVDDEAADGTLSPVAG